MLRTYLVCFLFSTSQLVNGQETPLVLKGVPGQVRENLYHQLVKNVITKNLSTPLHDSTEALWQDAFAAMELIQYKSPWADNKVHASFNNIRHRSIEFQRSLLELVFANYPAVFTSPVHSLFKETNHAKIFAMCAVYILQTNNQANVRMFIENKTMAMLAGDPGNPILEQLLYQVRSGDVTIDRNNLADLFAADFLPGNVLLFSFQRKNRNYPGLVIVRDSAGNFIKDGDKLFSVPQLARSLSGLPGYLTNGNTPEGIFRMDGFDTSASSLIGPTTNIQLTMPYEYKAAHFYRDSTLTDSSWNIQQYKNLLPASLRNYYPLYQSYYAGAAGRNEIIAHGTMVDPAYYRNKTYFPQTPTLGCLCTKETWDNNTGRLIESDQQKLADAVLRAGGPLGYAIVINLDDQQKAVALAEIIEFLSPLNQK